MSENAVDSHSTEWENVEDFKEKEQEPQKNYYKKRRYNYDNTFNEENAIQSWRETSSGVKQSFWQKFFHIKPKKLIPTVISREIHKIDKKAVNFNAVKVCRRLQDNGYQAFIVGGAVRDLLLHRNPKDFDVATNATPRCVKKIFTNARIIGRRFKLVHIIFRDCIIETATFRATVDDTEAMSDIMKNNVFGTIEDDCMRRDFSINALYYDPIKDVVVDYLGGYRDLLNHKIRVLREINESFTEDPVRMIRAVKFNKLLNCSLDAKTIKGIKKHGHLVSTCSPARLHEEINKMFRSHKSSIIFEGLCQHKLVSSLMTFFTNIDENDNAKTLCNYLKKLDVFMEKNNIVCIEVYWAVILYISLSLGSKQNMTNEQWDLIRANCHANLSPMRVPNKIIDTAFDIMHFYNLLYNDTSMQILNKIKRMGLSFYMYAFAIATGCQPIQNIFAGKVQPPNNTKTRYNNSQKKQNKPKADKKNFEKKKTLNQEEEIEYREPIKSKKVLTTTKRQPEKIQDANV